MATRMSRPEVLARWPRLSSPVALVRLRCDTELTLARASPRKPKLATPSRSSRDAILLVACRSRASSRSSSAIPRPSSRTRIRRVPAASTSMSTREAPASRLFSRSSLTTDAGRSTTSPAAIWLARRGERRWMDGTTVSAQLAGMRSVWPIMMRLLLRSLKRLMDPTLVLKRAAMPESVSPLTITYSRSPCSRS